VVVNVIIEASKGGPIVSFFLPLNETEAEAKSSRVEFADVGEGVLLAEHEEKEGEIVRLKDYASSDDFIGFVAAKGGG